MNVVVDTREDISLEALRQVAFDGARARFSDRAMKHIELAHEAFERYVSTHSDAFIYGVTSGLGPHAASRRTPAEMVERARVRRRSWGPFGGPLLPEYVSRAAVFAALSSIVSGHAALHPDAAQAVTHLLDGPLPRLPSRGLTAAGELMPNSVLRAALPLDEHIAAGWGFHTEAGMVGIAALLARRRLDLAHKAFALSIEAFSAPLDAYDPSLAAIWSDPYEAKALGALHSLLEGAHAPRRPYQAPISYRVLPRVLGQAERAVAALEEVARIALRSDNCNPAFLMPEAQFPFGRTLHNGGFHNASAAPALDAIVACWANLGAIAHRHAVKMHRGSVSLLPDQLVPEGADLASGPSTSYMEYVPTGFVEEMRRLAQPTLIPTADIAASQQDDLAITTPLAFVNERRVAECFDATLAVLCGVASQALHLVQRSAPPRLGRFLEAVREIAPPIESHRALNEDFSRLSDAFSQAVEFQRSPFGDGSADSSSTAGHES